MTIKRYYLKTLEIEGFRGINNEDSPLKLNFKEDKANSIFATNGLGKSSIFDALCYAIKGTIPRLERLQQIETPDRYFNNRFHSVGTSTIKLTFKPDDGDKLIEITVTRDATGKRTVSSPDVSNPDEFLRALNHDCLLVDYQSFNDFVTNTPLVRGRTFASLIGLSKISNLKQLIDSLCNTRNLASDFDLDKIPGEITRVKQQQTVLLNSINELLGKMGVSIDDCFDEEKISITAEQKLYSNVMLAPLVKGKGFCEIDFDELLKVIKDAEGSDFKAILILKQKELEEANKLISEDIGSDKAELETIREIVKEKEEQLEKSLGELYYNLYCCARNIFDKEVDTRNKNSCPLCESNLEYSETTFYDEVIKKIADFEKVEQLKESAITSWTMFRAKNRLIKLENSYIKNATERYFTRAETNFNSRTIKLTDIEPLFEQLGTLNNLISDHRKKLQEEIDKIKQSLPSSLVAVFELVTDCKSLRTAADNYKSNITRLIELEQKLKQRLRWKEFIIRVAEELAEAEVALSTDICNEIEGTAQKFFYSIMRNEEINIALDKSAANENLGLCLSKFYGINNVQAVPVLSESYRNALAMAIFLSALLRYRGPAKFIVFDDITSSFDSGNQFMLMELLKNEISTDGNPSGLQVIVLSHDGLLEKYFDKSVPLGKSWYHSKLQGRPPQGVVLVDLHQSNRLESQARDYLSSGLVEKAQPLVRQVLEYKLTEIIKQVNIPVPIDFAIRDDKKMVSNSLEAIIKAIELYHRAGILILTPTQLNDIKNIHVSTIVGNWVNHYETAITASFSSTMLISVLDSISDFTSCFKYACKCGGSIRQIYYKSLSEKRCPC